jgi:hypothetical protein
VDIPPFLNNIQHITESRRLIESGLAILGRFTSMPSQNAVKITHTPSKIKINSLSMKHIE